MNQVGIGGIAAIASVLVIGAVFGRLHGQQDAAIGDRVASVLFAALLILLLVYSAAGRENIGWGVIASAPLIAYTLMLAGTENKRGTDAPRWGFARDHFTVVIIGFNLLLYLAVVVAIAATSFGAGSAG